MQKQLKEGIKREIVDGQEMKKLDWKMILK